MAKRTDFEHKFIDCKIPHRFNLDYLEALQAKLDLLSHHHLVIKLNNATVLERLHHTSHQKQTDWSKSVEEAFRFVSCPFIAIHYYPGPLVS